MPFVQPTRKRRRSDPDEDALQSFYSIYASQQKHQQQQPSPIYTQQSQPHQLPASRRTLPISSKRARFTHEDIYTQPDTKQQLKRRTLDHGPEPLSSCGLRQNHQPHTKSAPALLTPCHICSTHPTRKNHLDSFAYCQGCGEWTCYICIRACAGWCAPDEEGAVSEQEALSRSFQMQDADDIYEDEVSRGGGMGTEEGDSARGEARWSWKASGHQGIICRKCCVEHVELGGEAACWACHLALDAAAG